MLADILARRNLDNHIRKRGAYGVRLQAVEELLQIFPSSPPAEICRYLKRNRARGDPKKAEPLLREYLNWRENELMQFPPTPQDLPMKFK